MAACPTAAWTPQPPPCASNDFETLFEQTPESDDALVASARNGNSDAFERLIERHQRFCRLRASSFLRNPDDANDEAQNAWGQAWIHLDEYRGLGSFRAWLGRIVANNCMMRLRKSRLVPMTSMDEVLDCDESCQREAIDQRALPEQVVGDKEVWDLMNKEIRAVPALLRRVLVMRDLHEFSLQDIAEDLGISKPAAKSRLMRARTELKKRLEKHHGAGGHHAMLHRPPRPQVGLVKTS